jgi:tyrosine-protein kinase Etk/Wzc
VAYFPVVGQLWAQLQGRKPATIALGWLQLPLVDGKPRSLCSRCWKKAHTGWKATIFMLRVGRKTLKKRISLLVAKLNAPTGTQFTLQTCSRLEAINALSNQFSVVESAKQSGVMTLTLTGNDPDRIAHVLNRIANNYLQQNIARQEAQDSRSLAFLQQQLPKIRIELEQAEERLNQYRKQRDSVDLRWKRNRFLNRLLISKTSLTS